MGWFKSVKEHHRVIPRRVFQRQESDESLDFAVLREVKARLSFMSNVSAWIGSVSRDDAERVLREAPVLREWAKRLDDGPVRHAYLKWIDHAEYGARSALREFETGTMKREHEEYRAKQDRVFGPVEEIRTHIPKPPTR